MERIKMKPTELRIGNLIYSESGLTTVSKEWFEFLDDNLKSWPIPITEEWLDGFEAMKKYTIHQNQFNGWRWVVNNLAGNHIKEIEFIHQLQNLYFALTDEELILKP